MAAGVSTPASRPVPGLPPGVVAGLAAIVGADSVLAGSRRLLAYECDGNTVFAGQPEAVVLPHDREEAERVIRFLDEHDVPWLPRGSGTGLSGGAVAERGGVIVDLVRLRRVVRVDPESQRAWVEPGVTNLALTEAVAPCGLFYAPDPSSQVACSIGGNVAENSGGSHCLKYGVTTNHVLGLEVVTARGERLRLGGAAPDLPGYDLTGFFVGSEGTLGVATEAVVRLVRRPQAVRTVLALFPSPDEASQTVSDVIAAGILPAAMEMMDRLAMEGVELGPYRVGYPPESGAVLLVEVDGLEAGLDEQAERIAAVCRRNGVQDVRVARTAEERNLWWQNRKTAFGAMGNLSPSYYVQDGVIPRSRLPRVLRRVEAIGREFGLRIANVFHAGDGNLHPLILFDDRLPGQRERAVRAGSEILRACVEEGGSITGEHGVGIEKREEMRLMYSDEELRFQAELRRVWDPKGLANPGKVLPV
ncbi:MAG: FAD-linked oxidase C-terminal domain-containing protein [Bacillota bacterium]|nr:FAD-linked oxidase C-terminal domain-containing protein [Bacillota bacterium]